MSALDLAKLGRDAAAYAKCYTQLVEALLREGLEEDRAREDARIVAYYAVTTELEPKQCPVCGTKLEG